VALDPGNPDPEGARAVARVLSDQGVDVTVVRDADQLDDTDVDGATVLVTSTDRLGRSTADRLLDHTAGARLVLVEPGPGTTAALGLTSLPFLVDVEEPREARCADPAYAGLSVQVDRAVEYPVPGGCFRGEHGALLAEPRPGMVLLGAGDLLSNDQVLRADDAAVALRLLGARERLVWYVPSLDDLVGDDGVSLTTLLPRWLRPALLLTAVAVLALLVWRARRLGPLATSRSPWSSRRSRPPGAGGGSTAAPATASTPPRRCARPHAPGWPTGSARVHASTLPVSWTPCSPTWPATPGGRAPSSTSSSDHTPLPRTPTTT